VGVRRVSTARAMRARKAIRFSAMRQTLARISLFPRTTLMQGPQQRGGHAAPAPERVLVSAL